MCFIFRSASSIVDNRSLSISEDEKDEGSTSEDDGWEESKELTPMQTRSDVIEQAFSSEDDEPEDEWKEVTPMPARWKVAPKRWRVTPQRLENGLKNEVKSNVDIIAGEKFYQHAFITEVMSEKDYLKTIDGVVVQNSSLHGYGVFTTKALEPGFLTAYPGVKRLTQTSAGVEDDYTVQVSTGSFFDARDIGVNSAQVGHLLNSSHPKRESSNSIPNCSYVSILVERADGTKEILPAVYVDKPVGAGVELLCDYHWRLAASIECDCEDEACVEAREEEHKKASLLKPDRPTLHETPVQKQSVVQKKSMDFISPTADMMMLTDSPVCTDDVCTPSPTSITPMNRKLYESTSYANRGVRGTTVKARQSQLLR